MVALWTAASLLLASAAAAGASVCPHNCSLNGRCIAAPRPRCTCDAGWTGLRCSTLDVRPTTRSAGLQLPNTSTWGGSVRLDKASGTYFMWASEITQHCGMSAWQTNSRVIRASASASAAGTGSEARVATGSSACALHLSFEQEAIQFPVWAHEPTVAPVAPAAAGSLRAVEEQREWVVFFSGRHPNSSSDVPQCGNCSGGTTIPGCKRPKGLPAGVDRDPTYVSWAPAPRGPWAAPVRVSVARPAIDTNLAAVLLPAAARRAGAAAHTGGRRLLGIWRSRSREPLPLGHHSQPHLLTAADWRDPSTYVWHAEPMFTTQELGGAVEDPFVWVNRRGEFHALFHVQHGECLNCGSHAYSATGAQGTWVYTGIAYTANTTFVGEAGGGGHPASMVAFKKCERPHLILDGAGVPIALTNGVTVGGTDASYTLLRPLGSGGAALGAG